MVQIWKKGSTLRIDSTLANLSEKYRTERGHITYQLMGMDTGTVGWCLRELSLCTGGSIVACFRSSTLFFLLLVCRGRLFCSCCAIL